MLYTVYVLTFYSLFFYAFEICCSRGWKVVDKGTTVDITFISILCASSISVYNQEQKNIDRTPITISSVVGEEIEGILISSVDVISVSNATLLSPDKKISDKAVDAISIPSADVVLVTSAISLSLKKKGSKCMFQKGRRSVSLMRKLRI